METPPPTPTWPCAGWTPIWALLPAATCSPAGIFKKSMGARHRVGIGLSYRLARLHRLAEFIPWNRFLGSLNVYKYGLASPPAREMENISRGPIFGDFDTIRTKASMQDIKVRAVKVITSPRNYA